MRSILGLTIFPNHKSPITGFTKMKQHRLSRMELLVGETGMAHLAGASVAVFGIGGVGSYAVEALARAGVGRLTLVIR
jgi:tRNA A37 threonylcarbamoyladenosine dehydratase